ncbi:hypothetical protein EW145_g8513 [Phellinidium pouzarii]|uniref:Uncharacterized protein n=1 Tax=Phellinidium pouzarii TaxID=167371 RepID=A0A4S4K9V3_9AGAM|nr:hypothetical protein EW145_g8513 [Phellinidium pouzarii]
MSLRPADMAPPPDRDRDRDRDAPLPSLPHQQLPLNGSDRRKDIPHDLPEKYSRLKRHFFLLDDKQKETNLDLQKSMERNTKLRSERNILLDRIIELEDRNKLYENHLSLVDPVFLNANKDLPPTASGAFPRSLISQRAQAAFIENLQQAMSEVNVEDPYVDPVLTSRHVGPMARKRLAEELEQRQEEQAREQKRVRRTRAAGAGAAGGSMSAAAAAAAAAKNGNGNGNGIGIGIGIGIGNVSGK